MMKSWPNNYILGGPGTGVMILSWCITLNTMWQMTQHLHDLGKYAFGPRLGAWMVLPQQLIVQVGCDIVYMVTGGKCLMKFMEIVCTHCVRLKLSYWIVIFGSLHFFLSQLPNFHSVSGVSLAAAVMSLSYSTIAWVGCLKRGRIENVNYGYKHTSSIDFMFQVSFAYAGHAVSLEIQATIPSTPEKPSKIPMWKALQRPAWLIATANLMVVVHVIGSYQVYAMPVFDMLERLVAKILNLQSGIALRLVTRTAYVAFTLFIGVSFPFFGDLLGFFGGFGFAPTSYFLPSVIWLIIKKPKRFSLSWLINWSCVIIGVFIMLASTIGGLRNIIIDSSSYSFYS